jgi:hypothetical protein
MRRLLRSAGKLSEQTGRASSPGDCRSGHHGRRAQEGTSREMSHGNPFWSDGLCATRYYLGTEAESTAIGSCYEESEDDRRTPDTPPRRRSEPTRLYSHLPRLYPPGPSCYFHYSSPGVAELTDTAGSKSAWDHSPCGFDSLLLTAHASKMQKISRNRGFAGLLNDSVAPQL